MDFAIEWGTIYSQPGQIHIWDLKYRRKFHFPLPKAASISAVDLC
jgi:hypothetical protein